MSNINPDNKIKQLLDRLQKIDTKAILITIIRDNEKYLCDILRYQMRGGFTSKGETPLYSPGYLKYKETLPTYFAEGRADFYVIGNFQKGIFIFIGSDEYNFTSSDSKTMDLQGRYSLEIFEYNETSKDQARKIITPKYLEEYAKQLHG